jgi:hypothetical protein
MLMYHPEINARSGVTTLTTAKFSEVAPAAVTGINRSTSGKINPKLFTLAAGLIACLVLSLLFYLIVKRFRKKPIST